MQPALTKVISIHRRTSEQSLRIKINYAILASTALCFNLAAIPNARASEADYNFLIESDWHSCQQISSEYQEVYAFETPSFFVNICQKDDIYFYSGEAKRRNANSIFIPATPLEHNRGFQAKNGNVSYTVILPFSRQNSTEDLTLNPEEAILTIKRNDRPISVESSLTKYCHRSEAIAFDEIEIDPYSFSYLAVVAPEQNLNPELLSNNTESLLPLKIFDSNSRFDFYRLDGKLHRLATCD